MDDSKLWEEFDTKLEEESRMAESSDKLGNKLLQQVSLQIQ